MKPGRILALALTAASLSCSTLRVDTDFDPGTDFTKYRSFVLRKGAAATSSLVVDRLENALANALQARGLSRVPEGGDLDLFPHFILGMETRINSYGYAGWAGWRWGGGMQSATVERIPAGTVVVDLVDAKTNRAVWRGTAKDEISRMATPEERQRKANVVAQRLFESFPPGGRK